MSEEIILNDAQPEAENKEIFVPVKFNKQILNLDLNKAQELAQKGMKFDAISKDYQVLKDLALEGGKSVGEFLQNLQIETAEKKKAEILEKCGGDLEFAEHILGLKKGNDDQIKGFSEVKEHFPEIKTPEDLPESVIENAKLKGTLLLDEYLRYLHHQNTVMKNSIKAQRKAEESAMGDLSNKAGIVNPETAEFLKGLWRK